nr:hypothetical protein [Tanacetum cinerariifolium]
MVAFLSKCDASAGFDQLVDFINAQVIRYALMVNPTIYVSCIKQFWATTLIKKANDVVTLQALIDRKKVVITEDVIRQDLCLDDADGVECLPNEEIFVELARIGYEKPHPKLTFYKVFFSTQWKFLIHTLIQCVSAKRPAWNEFSCSMASAVICLATGRKFNFSKYIFNSMVKNVDSPSKFLMYPRFLQVMINNQVDDLSSHTTKYTSPTLTQKVFANMRRVGKGFSRVETHLFASMLTCATLSQKVAQLEKDKLAQALEILKLKRRVKKLDKRRRSKSFGLKRLRKVGSSQRVESSTETVMGAELQGRKDDDNAATKDVNAAEPTVFDDEEYDDKKQNIDCNAVAEQIQEKHLDNIRKYQSLKRKPISIAQTRKNMIIYLKNMARYKMEHFRVMTCDKVRPIFEMEYNKVQTLFKLDKYVEEPQKKRVAEETLL